MFTRAVRTTPRALSQEVTRTIALAAASHESTPFSEGRVGCVPVLLLDEENNKGIVAEIRVWVEEHDSETEFWGTNSGFQMLARDAVRDAFQAAAGARALKAAPFSFTRHRVRLVVDHPELADAELEVDGRSLGLSAALAFASAWLKQPIGEDVVPMGTLSPQGRVGAIRGGDAKSSAARDAHKGALRVLTAPDGLAEVVDEIGVSVETLHDALAASGLDLARMGAEMPESARQRERALDGLVRDIQEGAIGQHGEEPWLRLADEVRRLADSLEGAPGNKTDLVHARCMAALAYSHAGHLGDVGALLWDMGRPETAGPEAVALFDIVELGKHIDSRTLNESEGRRTLRRVHADLDLLRDMSSHLSGQAAGTLGRAYTHLGEIDQAIPWLEVAVEEHKAHAPHEVARSRVYLASALRMQGELHEALEELVAGRRDLRDLTRSHSTEYEAMCRLYMNYELARVLVSLDRPEEALDVAAEALSECETRGWWPQLGVLRVVAWALRSAGRDEEADGVVERMRVAEVPPAYADLVDALVEEAEGYGVGDGEVY